MRGGRGGQGAGQGAGRGGGGGGGYRLGPGGHCVCPNCGYKEQHQLSVPCYNNNCPKCDTPLTRLTG